MSRSSRVAESVLLAAFLTAGAGIRPASDLGFDRQGRLTTPMTATTPAGQPEGDPPPQGPPNVQCPC